MIQLLYGLFYATLPPREQYPDLPDWFWPETPQTTFVKRAPRKTFRGLGAFAFSAVPSSSPDEPFTAVVFLGMQQSGKTLELRPTFLKEGELKELIALVEHAEKGIMAPKEAAEQELLFTAPNLAFAAYYEDPSTGREPEAVLLAPGMNYALSRESMGELVKFLHELKEDLDKIEVPEPPEEFIPKQEAKQEEGDE